METEDFIDGSLPTPPGNYVSQSREIKKITKKADGSTTYELHFTGGLVSQKDGKTYNATFPLRNWVSTKLFALPDRPGHTSSAAQYLKAVGYDTKGMTLSSFDQAIKESVTIPVQVFVKWEDRSEKQADGTWANKGLKLKDFVSGTDSEGNKTYTPVVTINGESYKAKAVIGSFSKLG